MAGESTTVVALGASAGGVQAFRTFLDHVPPKSGMAYVVVLHLSPDRESHVADLLQNVTAMPVAVVTGRVAIEPDHVYVVASRHFLTVTEGSLVASAITRDEERRAP